MSFKLTNKISFLKWIVFSVLSFLNTLFVSYHMQIQVCYRRITIFSFDILTGFDFRFQQNLG